MCTTTIPDVYIYLDSQTVLHYTFKIDFLWKAKKQSKPSGIMGIEDFQYFTINRFRTTGYVRENDRQSDLRMQEEAGILSNMQIFISTSIFEYT